MSQSRATMNAPPAVPAGPAPPEFIVGAATLSKTEWASMEAAMPSEEIATHRMLSFWMKDCAKKMGVKAIPEETESDEEDESGDEGESDGEMSPGAKAREKQRLAQEAADKEFEEKAKKEKNWSQVHLAYIESKSNYRGIMTPLNFTNWIWAEIIRPKLLDAKGEMMDMTEVHNFFLSLQNQKGFNAPGYSFLRNTLGDAIEGTEFARGIENSLSSSVCSLFSKFTNNAKKVEAKLKTS